MFVMKEAPPSAMAERTRRSVAARALAGLVALTMWLSPLQLSLQQARQAAGVLAAGAVAVDTPAVLAGAARQGWVRWAANHLPVTFTFGLQAAHAAPIVDPTAPVRFQPTLTTTTGPGVPPGSAGVPIVQVTAPNAQGVSLNQYRSFVVDPIGLILGNNVAAGGSFLGGQVPANPNLATTGPANLIINQVTTSAPAQIDGTVEVFGAPASVVIAAPGGVYTNGASFTNATQVTLTTGIPQFLDANGAAARFDAASAAGFLVNGGRIQIANPSPGDPNGVGIDGTVGNLNLIGESVGVDAALYAGNQINIVAGRQLVTPGGTGFTTTATGPNNANANNTASGGVAIDATAFGAMNAGQISLLSTADGVGVRAVGNLAASAGHLTIDSAGNLTVGNHYAKGDVALTSGGSVNATGNGQAEGGYALLAAQDATLDGKLAANQAVMVDAGGTIGGTGGIAAQQAARLAAGGSVDLGGAVSGAQVTVSAAGNDDRGDIRLGGDVTSPGTIALDAARDMTLDGNVVSAVDLNLSTHRNLTLNGAAGSTSGNVTLTGVTGSVTTHGEVISPGSLTVKAGTDASLGGKVVATGTVSVTAQTGSISTRGQIGSEADLTLAAAQNVTIDGQAQSTGRTAITATRGNVTIDGALTSNGDASISAAQDATITGSLASGGNSMIAATNGSATVNGSLLSLGDTNIAAGQNANLGGSVRTVGDLDARAGQTLSVGSLPFVGGNATLRGRDIRLDSVAGQDNEIGGSLDATATDRLALAGHTQATNVKFAGQTVSNTGTTVAMQTLAINGGTVDNASTGALAGHTVNVNAMDLANRGMLGGQTANVTATNSLDNAGGLIVGVQSLNVTAGALTSNADGSLFAGDLSGKNTTVGDLTLTVDGGAGSFNNAEGRIGAGNDLTVNTPNQVFDPSAATTGTLDANNTLTLAAQAIHNTGTWDVPGGNAVLTATKGISNTGTIQKAGDLTLSTTGTLSNSGQIVGGSNLSLSGGTLTNAGIVHANRDLALAGNTSNAGMVEALGNIAITGSEYDNRGGTTQAGKNLAVDVDGTLNNTGSVIGALGDIHIAAQRVINDRGAPVNTAEIVSGQVLNEALVDSVVIGSRATANTICAGDAGCNTTMTGPPVNVTLGDLKRNPDGTIPLLLGNVEVPTGDLNGSMQWVLMWHLGQDPASYPNLPAAWQQDVPLSTVTVDRTVVKQAEGVAGQIISGGKLDMTAASLSNKGGVISARRDATLNVGTLDNGHSASLLDGVTDTVNQSSLSAFLAQLQEIGGTTTGGLAAPGNTLMFGPLTRSDCNGDNGCTISAAADTPFIIGKAADGSAVTGPVESSITERIGKAGQILAGGNLNLNGTGDLTNAGDLAALGDIRITTPGTFTNQGFYDARITSTPGCMPGSTTCKIADAHYDDLRWHQQNNTVAAVGTLTVEAASVRNLNGTLGARGDVNVTAQESVINQSGTIQSIKGDVSISAPTLVNKAMDPVTLHKDYGDLNPPYAGGCNGGGSYKGSNCSSSETVAAGPAGVIQGERDVILSGTTLANNGGMLSGGRNVTVTTAEGVDNSSLVQNANWAGMWVEKTGVFSSDKTHTTGGTAVLGSQESLIRAGDVLNVTANGQVVNTGNLMGKQVDLSGTQLLNGYTSPGQPTPPSTLPKQVISLGLAPVPAGSLPPANPAADPSQPWQFNPVIVTAPGAPTTGSAQTINWHFTAKLDGNPLTAPGANTDRTQYVTGSAATSVLAGVTPDDLLSQLPVNLRPGSNITFYYDPYTENQQLQRAALQQTGRDSFTNGLSYDSQNQLTVTDLEKLTLYKNAADYAAANNITLGTALTQAQINALDKPMLWYVEQTMPDPSCNTASSRVCPGVIALVPQVYLPEGYTQVLAKPTGGNIVGNNVDLDFAGGKIRNSGTITAADTLSFKAASLDLSPNVADIGKSAYRVDGGWLEVTGTQVQPGGFMSAMHMNVNADSIHAVNDALRITNADGSINREATDALIAQLKGNLGESYTTGILSDEIHTRFIKEDKGLGSIGLMVAIVAAVALAVMTAGSSATALATAQAAAAETGMTTLIATGSFLEATAASGILASPAFAVGGMANLAISGALGSIASSVAIQLAMTGKIKLGQLATAGIAGAITGGLTGYFGATYGVERLLASTAAGCGTAAIQGGDCQSGAITGFATAAIAWAADAMRQDQIESSRRFKGIYDTQDKSGALTSNATGPSAGIDGDGMKIAGTRVSFDDLKKYGMVVERPDGAWDFTGTVINPKTSEVWTLTDALNKEGGLTGGFQGLGGTLANSPVSARHVYRKDPGVLRWPA
jgi:filamentous hemagglutinin